MTTAQKDRLHSPRAVIMRANPPRRCEFIPLAAVEHSAQMFQVFGRYLGFEPYLVWSYHDSEVTFGAIFGTRETAPDSTV
jgi:hypothetical protein